MPSRNRVKSYTPDTYYHAYNRGLNGRRIFSNDDDYRAFLNYGKRYLSPAIITDPKGRPYAKLHHQVNLLAYCLMPNHFHLLLYQTRPHGMDNLLQRWLTSYVPYFNKRHNRKGPLFQDIYKACDIDNEKYLWHISRYIHLNPLDIKKEWRGFPYSSIDYYLGNRQADWLNPKKLLDMHREYGQDYDQFVAYYIDHKQALDEIKLYLE